LPTPEQQARIEIDQRLAEAGWIVQDRDQINLQAGRGVAIREFAVEGGAADYALFVDQKAVGIIEAKPAGTTLSGVAEQAAQYAAGFPSSIPNAGLPLPFLYESTGAETMFRDDRDPYPRSRRLFAFHRPETLAEWIQQGTSLRQRLQAMPERYRLITNGLWPPQIEAIRNLEQSFAENRPRALIQMATGSGKTYTAVTFTYRLLRFARAQRVLFLVDRNNLGRQAFREFDQYVTPDDGRKFTELYNVQRLKSNVLDHVSKVHITTIQRLYSILSGEPELDPEIEEHSLFEIGSALEREPPKTVVYNPDLPIEYYDFIIIDECHRSIYNLWRQVLEYFDAFLIGLTATPSKHTFGFFNQNLVMEYSRQQAVADGVNVDGEVYRIRTHITEKGSSIEAGFTVPKRDRLTRRQRWEQLDEEFTYDPGQLDHEVVAQDQIRTVIRAFKERVLTEIFPGRTEVPKTLIFAKDDSHAEDIVHIVREEFGKGDDFCKKITYRVTGVKPEDLIAEFRNSYNPRIAVSVDMIATGTDIRPLEVLLFMRPVKSRVLFEQMLGRGTRVVSTTELQNVTPDARVKDHFVIVDAVGVTEQPKLDPQPMDRKRSVPLKKLLELVALGAVGDDDLSSLATRLARLERKLTPREQARIQALSDGLALKELASGLLRAIDPDEVDERAREGLPPDLEPSPQQLQEAAEALRKLAIQPLAANPDLRNLLLDLQQQHEQIIDDISQDDVIEIGPDPQATARARAQVESFQQFIEEHKDEIAALQILYNLPHERRALSYEQVRELAERLQQPPHAWTTESLWRAYAQLERDRVRGLHAPRVLADVVSLVRHALQMDDELVPFPERVQARYQDWLAAQQAEGRQFTPEQRWWLDRIAEVIGQQAGIAIEDLDYGEFFNRGGRVAALRTFGEDLRHLLEEFSLALLGNGERLGG